MKLRLICVAVAGSSLVGCGGAASCHYGPVAGSLQLNGPFTASTYYQSCGGRHQRMEVSLDSGESTPLGPGNVFSVRLKGPVANTWPVLATWTDSGLDISYDSRVQIERQQRLVDGIRVTYRQLDPATRP